MAHYCCYDHVTKQKLEGISYCAARTYRQSDTENAVVAALDSAIQHPEWIKVAREIHLKAKAVSQKLFSEDVDIRQELQVIDKALEQLKIEQAVGIKAQIAGMSQGVSADAYAEVFADTASRRKDMEDRRDALNRMAKKKKSTAKLTEHEETGREIFLRDVHQSLISSFVTEAEKRVLIGRVIEKVICQKGGADVVFVPGLFGDDDGGSQAALSDTNRKFLTAWASYLGL